ncbi:MULTISPECIES: NUDIX hydrolase [Micromonospora]|uniref:NUDIX hydrolase n=1 Tax=Micromonospora sp. BRA006-A TaxID=2962860 RepID=UPI00296E7036|nr:NUDIX domain-containing protein [Micromonospora sp. BRA006-A]MDW3846379.1 NUDIX domain-containing protein [Micromonospora sp. BRA006-A]
MRPEDRQRDPNLDAIQKVGAAIVRDGKVMVVRKKDQPSAEYYMPGGRMEEGETQRETLFREIREELCVDIDHYEYVGSFEDRAVFEGTPIVIHAYLVTVVGEPSAANEVKEYRWIGQDHEREGLTVSSIMAKQVIPALVKGGRL